MKLGLLSPNLVLLLQEILANQKICKLINYDQKNPYSQPDIEPFSLLLNKVFPFPFDPNSTTDEGTQLRVYYQDTNLKNNQIIEDTTIFFDIICAKTPNIWLMDDGESKIRPYEILSELVTHLSDRSIETLGKVRFKRFVHVNVNKEFDCIRLIGDVFTIGK